MSHVFAIQWLSGKSCWTTISSLALRRLMGSVRHMLPVPHALLTALWTPPASALLTNVCIHLQRAVLLANEVRRHRRHLEGRSPCDVEDRPILGSGYSRQVGNHCLIIIHEGYAKMDTLQVGRKAQLIDARLSALYSMPTPAEPLNVCADVSKVEVSVGKGARVIVDKCCSA